MRRRERGGDRNAVPLARYRGALPADEAEPVSNSCASDGTTSPKRARDSASRSARCRPARRSQHSYALPREPQRGGAPALLAAAASAIIGTLPRGGAVWQLVGLITRRSQVQILPPQPNNQGLADGRPLLFAGLCPKRATVSTSAARAAHKRSAYGAK